MLYLGLMSGTSADGIDAVLAEFEAGRFVGLQATHHHDYAPALRARLIELSLTQPLLSLRELTELDAAIGRHFAQAAQQLLAASATPAARVRAIGSHGQTVFHDGPAGLTLQLGDANLIAELTGIDTVADFRRRDLALGGQGAPLVPAFHQAVFARKDVARCILNIGGIANISLLPRDDTAVIGFDTGPGNALLDEWIAHSQGLPFDRDGAFGARGRVQPALLAALRADPYFERAAPKSTGRDYFQLAWARARFPTLAELAPDDVQATFCELTALTIAEAIRASQPETAEVLVCGGGSRNADLMQRLGSRLPGLAITATDDHGLAAEWIEAAAFAWLAMRTIEGLPGNLPAVTGARAPAVLGGLYPGRTPG